MTAPKRCVGCLKIWAEQTYRQFLRQSPAVGSLSDSVGLGHQPMTGICPDNAMESKQSPIQRVKTA